MTEPPQQPPSSPRAGDGAEHNQPPAGQSQPSWDQPSRDQPSWQQAPQPGQQPPQHPYGPGGYQQQGYPEGRYPQAGFPQAGYPQAGFPQAGYPQAGFPQAGGPHGGDPSYSYGAAPATAGSGFVAGLGARLRQRPEPRFGVSLAAGGIGVAIAGVAVWSFGYLIEGIHFSSTGGFEGGGRRFLGFGLSMILVLLGYGLAVTRRRGPLATAGAIGAAIGVPLALTFITFDLTSVSGGLPANTDLIYVLSVVVYLASYLLVPGMRARSFLLALAALLFANYIEFKVASGSVTRASASIFGAGSFDTDDIGTGGLTAVALVLGLAYLGVAIVLDRRGLHGAATAMVVAGTVTVLGGVLYGVLTFKQIGTGVELIILGAALSWYGAHFGRRFTTWFWMVALVVGFGLVVQKALPDSPAGAGISLIVIGLVVVVLAQVVATVTNEAPDIDEGAAPDGSAAVVGGHRH